MDDLPSLQGEEFPADDLPRVIRRRKETPEIVERRAKPDLVLKTSYWANFIAWILALLALAQADRARPAWRAIGLDAWFGVSRRSYWDQSLLDGAFALLGVAFITTLVAAGLRAVRVKRSYDRIPWGLLFLMASSGIAVAIYLIVRNQ
ncbi:MAG: hypothetical protein AAGF12_09275 [Myxococcota bacterium]